MNFSQSIKSVFSNYSNFTGRASRSEFWYWNLFCILVGLFLLPFDMALFGVSLEDDKLHPLGDLFTLATLIPSFAVMARRLHDVNRSGWWMLIVLTIIGLIPLLYWNCQKGTEGENRFGADPLAL